MKEDEAKRLEMIRQAARREVVSKAYKRDRFLLPLDNYERRDDARRIGPGEFQKINRQNSA